MKAIQFISRRAFTLIELMVVVAIIGLLLAITVPSLMRARENARQVVCLTNLRALSVASFMYQQENRGYFPTPGSGTKYLSDWFMWETAYAGDPASVTSFANRRNLMNPAGLLVTLPPGPHAPYVPPYAKYGSLIPYMANTFVRKTYICPSDQDLSKHLQYKYSYTANVNFFNIPNFADTVAATSTHPQILNRPIRYSEIKSPSSKIIMIEEDATGTDDSAWAPSHHGIMNGDQNNIIAIRHSMLKEDKNIENLGKGNAAFADGHAEYVERKDAMTPQYYYPFDTWKY